MKKQLFKQGIRLFALGVIMYGAVVFADLTAEQQAKVDVATVKVVAVMHQYGVTPDAFLDLLNSFREGFMGDAEKEALADALEKEVMDAYYQIENFAECVSFSDGCNDCFKDDQGTIACTLKMCEQYDTPVCHSYKNEQEQADLDAAMDLWMEETHDLYIATIQASCFCTEEYRRPISYQVGEGEVKHNTASYADENPDEDPVNFEMSPELRSVEGMFQLIQEAIDENADKITVTYHEELGYPMEIMIDYSFMMADEEQHFTYMLTENVY